MKEVGLVLLGAIAATASNLLVPKLADPYTRWRYRRRMKRWPQRILRSRDREER